MEALRGRHMTPGGLDPPLELSSSESQLKEHVVYVLELAMTGELV